MNDETPTTSAEFFWNGEPLRGLCGHCGVEVDSTDPNHRVTSIVRGGRGVECVLRADIHASQGGPLCRSCKGIGMVWNPTIDGNVETCPRCDGSGLRENIAVVEGESQ